MLLHKNSFSVKLNKCQYIWNINCLHEQNKYYLTTKFLTYHEITCNYCNAYNASKTKYNPSQNIYFHCLKLSQKYFTIVAVTFNIMYSYTREIYDGIRLSYRKQSLSDA